MSKRFRFLSLFGLFVVALLFAGCGYTTRGFVYDKQELFIKPVVNTMNIATESSEFAGFRTFPVLLEKRLTNTVINQFNVDGHLQVVSIPDGAMTLTCEITDYRKETMRYTDDDNVKEQRLWLSVHVVLLDADGATPLRDRSVTGQATFFLTGDLRKPESIAQNDLIEDAARRIVETVIEEW